MVNYSLWPWGGAGGVVSLAVDQVLIKGVDLYWTAGSFGTHDPFLNSLTAFHVYS